MAEEKLNAGNIDDDADFDNEDTQEDKYLTFTIGEEDYGFEIKYVVEIIGIQKITDVPDMPHFIKGVINLRGKVIPVMDVRLRFSFEKREYDDRTCIIVINVNEKLVGVIVDRVSEVLDIPKTQIEPAPNMKKNESSKFLQGMGKIAEKVVILLNADKLLFEDR